MFAFTLRHIGFGYEIFLIRKFSYWKHVQTVLFCGPNENVASAKNCWPAVCVCILWYVSDRREACSLTQTKFIKRYNFNKALPNLSNPYVFFFFSRANMLCCLRNERILNYESRCGGCQLKQHHQPFHKWRTSLNKHKSKFIIMLISPFFRCPLRLDNFMLWKKNQINQKWE